jgi:hypothetical protein
MIMLHNGMLLNIISNLVLELLLYLLRPCLVAVVLENYSIKKM